MLPSTSHRKNLCSVEPRSCSARSCTLWDRSQATRWSRCEIGSSQSNRIVHLWHASCLAIAQRSSWGRRRRWLLCSYHSDSLQRRELALLRPITRSELVDSHSHPALAGSKCTRRTVEAGVAVVVQLVVYRSGLWASSTEVLALRRPALWDVWFRLASYSSLLSASSTLWDLRFGFGLAVANRPWIRREQ